MKKTITLTTLFLLTCVSMHSEVLAKNSDSVTIQVVADIDKKPDFNSTDVANLRYAAELMWTAHPELSQELDKIANRIHNKVQSE